MNKNNLFLDTSVFSQARHLRCQFDERTNIFFAVFVIAVVVVAAADVEIVFEIILQILRFEADAGVQVRVSKISGVENGAFVFQQFTKMQSRHYKNRITKTSDQKYTGRL